MRLIKIIAISLLIISCDSVDNTNTAKEEVVETSSYVEVKPLSYKGHKYLWFRAKVKKGFGGVTHDPDCKCMSY